MANELCVKDFFVLKTAEEVQVALKEKYVLLSEEEILAICTF